MRDRHVRWIVLGLILAFPVLVTALSSPTVGAPAPWSAEALGSLALVEGIVVVGLLGAYRARRGLLAGREVLTADARVRLTDAHFGPAAAPAVFESATH